MPTVLPSSSMIGRPERLAQAEPSRTPLSPHNNCLAAARTGRSKGSREPAQRLGTSRRLPQSIDDRATGGVIAQMLAAIIDDRLLSYRQGVAAASRRWREVFQRQAGTQNEKNREQHQKHGY